jgi:hypothetical protein
MPRTWYPKQADQRDACRDTTKEVIGSWLDNVGQTVHLPPSCAKDLLKEVKSILKKVMVPLKWFRSIVGRSQNAGHILQVRKTFFNPMNNSLKGLPTFVGLSWHEEVRHALLDTATIIRDLASQPTPVSKSMQQPLDFTGYYGDASAFAGASHMVSPMIGD